MLIETGQLAAVLSGPHLLQVCLVVLSPLSNQPLRPWGQVALNHFQRGDLKDPTGLAVKGVK